MMDLSFSSKYVSAACLLVLGALPAYTASKFVWAICKARSLENKLIAQNIPFDKENQHLIWGVGHIFGNLGPTRALNYLHSKLGGVIVFRALQRVSVSVSDPKVAQLVISKLNLPKAEYDSVKELLGDSLVTSNGTVWQLKRKAVNPAFKVTFLQDILAPVVVNRTNIMFETLFPKAPEGSSINLQDAFSKVTLDVIGLAGFNYDFGFVTSIDSEEGHGLSRLIVNVLEEPNLRSINPLRRYYKIREAVQYSKDLTQFKALGRKVIREARERQSKQDKERFPSSIIDLILQQSSMSEEEILNEVVTFLFAGHETSASTLTFMFILLDMFPKVKAKVIEEVDEVLSGRDPTFEDIGRFKYITAVLKETLRLFPIGWATSRITTEPTQLGQYILPANTAILIDFVALHRNPTIWDSPLEFIPERWLTHSSIGETASEGVEERASGSVPFSYLPFSGGLRSCIGKPFAEIEMKLVAAMIVQKYEWKVQVPESWHGRPFHDIYKDGTTVRPLPHYVWVAPRN